LIGVGGNKGFKMSPEGLVPLWGESKVRISITTERMLHILNANTFHYQRPLINDSCFLNIVAIKYLKAQIQLYFVSTLGVGGKRIL
jgi:hypothetical protein